MNWLDNNPFGMALLAACGVLVLAALGVGWTWSQPASSGAAPAVEETGPRPLLTAVSSDLGPASDYQEVVNRPVFNESRQPVIAIEGEDEGIEITGDEVADAPEVRLTGVVITPDQRFVTLTPNKEGDPMIASEGMALEGEYVGWSVTRIQPRQVTLEANNGRSLDIELVVHNQEIEAPPEPELPADADEEGAEGAENVEPMSRAEEIRQRIQERREQLRQQAEQQEADKEAERAEQKTTYQQAIRSMMNRNGNNDNESEDDEGDE